MPILFLSKYIYCLRQHEVRFSPNIKSCYHLLQWKPFKNDEEKFLLHLRYLDFCPDIFGHVEKQLNKKATVNFEIYDINYLERKNCHNNTDKYRQ